MILPKYSAVKKSICFFLFYGHKKTTLTVADIFGILTGPNHVTLVFVMQKITADLAGQLFL